MADGRAEPWKREGESQFGLDGRVEEGAPSGGWPVQGGWVATPGAAPDLHPSARHILLPTAFHGHAAVFKGWLRQKGSGPRCRARLYGSSFRSSRYSAFQA